MYLDLMGDWQTYERMIRISERGIFAYIKVYIYKLPTKY